MARKFSVLNIVLAGTIGVGMISGCNDRFGEMKARKHTRADYDKYAREHGQPTLAEIEQRNAPQKPLGEDKTRRDGDSTLGPRDGGGIDDKNDKANKGGDKSGNSNNNNNNNNNADNTDKGDGSSRPDPIDASAVSQILESPGPYPKKPWVDAFNALLAVPRPELQKVFLGMTVGSGARDGQSKLTVRAVVKYNGQNYVLSLKPGADGKDAAEIKFDAERVTPLDIELRLTELGEVDPAASKAVRLVAACLDAADAGTCREIGMIIEVPQEQTARGVFKSAVGNNSTVDITKTGVDQSNLGANLKPFVEGQKMLDGSKPPIVLPGGGLSGGNKPTEPAKPGTEPVKPGTEPVNPPVPPPAAGNDDEVSDKSLLTAATLTAEGVAAGHKAALEARDQILKVNGSNKSAEEKKAEAKKLVEAASEAADTTAEGADLIVRLTGHVLPNLKTPAAKERVEKMIADAKTQKAEAMAAADEAEKAAGAIVTDPWQVPFPEDKPAAPAAPAAGTSAPAASTTPASGASQPAAASSTPAAPAASIVDAPTGNVGF